MQRRNYLGSGFAIRRKTSNGTESSRYEIWSTTTKSESNLLRGQIGAININGENLTARRVLERYPQLRGFLQPKRRISEKSLYAKLRKFFREGKIPDHIINEDPPEFYRSNGALDGAFIEYKLGDPRIQNHDIVSIVEYLKTRILRLIETHPNTKIYLSIHVTMFQRSSGETEMEGLRTGAQEFLIGTNPETVFETLRNILYERLAKLERSVGSWVDARENRISHDEVCGISCRDRIKFQTASRED